MDSVDDSCDSFVNSKIVLVVTQQEKFDSNNIILTYKLQEVTEKINILMDIGNFKSHLIKPHNRQKTNECHGSLKPICATWNYEFNYWDDYGCILENLSPTIDKCVCNHTGNIAIVENYLVRRFNLIFKLYFKYKFVLTMYLCRKSVS